MKRYNTGDIKREKKGERKRWLIYSTTSWQASGFLLLVLIHVGEDKKLERLRQNSQLFLYSYYLQDAVVEWVLISFYNHFEVELRLASFPTSKGSPNFFDVKLHLTLFPTSKDSSNLSSHAEVSYQGSGNLDNREIKLMK